MLYELIRFLLWTRNNIIMTIIVYIIIIIKYYFDLSAYLLKCFQMMSTNTANSVLQKINKNIKLNFFNTYSI